jgi:hypothetical protein
MLRIVAKVAAERLLGLAERVRVLDARILAWPSSLVRLIALRSSSLIGWRRHRALLLPRADGSPLRGACLFAGN